MVLGYNETRQFVCVREAPLEVEMPRFIGSRSHYIWWELLALAILILVILVVLHVTGTADIF